MTTLLNMMLEAARLMGVVREGVTTGGSTTTLVDSLLTEPAAYFTGGTVWVLSGTLAGTCQAVKTYSEGKITLTTALAGAILTGVEYAVATPEFPKHKLKQAALSALRYTSILKTDDTLTVIANTQEYTLPTGISNVKRVEIANSASVPYGFTKNFHWKEWNGKVVFESGFEPSGYIIRLWYQSNHGDIAETGSVLPGIDINWLKWATVAFLFRNQIKTIQKDNPTAIDLLNEARTMEAEARREASKYQLTHMTSDPKLAGW